MRFLTFFILTLLAQTPIRPSGVAGIVVRQGQGTPLSRATVVLQGETDRSKVYSAVTLTDGRFSFDNVSSGRYRISATRDGYLPAETGVGGLEACGAFVTVEANRQTADISLTMIPGGVIAGRIYDRDGEPASNVMVQAIKYTYQNGNRVLTSVQSTQTNDLGEYRLFWLAPGRYLVAAALDNAGGRFFVEGSRLINDYIRQVATPSAQPSTTTPPAFIPAPSFTLGAPASGPGVVSNGRSAASELGPRISPMYFPSSSDPKTATPVELHAGETFQGADMLVTRVQPRTIRGTIRNDASAETPGSMSVSLISRIAQPNGGGVRSISVRADGSFEIPGVLPGGYTIFATGIDSGGRLIARTFVDVVGDEVQNIQVVVSKGFSLSGHVTTDDPAVLARIETVSLVSISEDRVAQPASLSAPLRDGAFTIDGIPPGDYLAYVAFTGSNSIYNKSMRLGSADVRNGFRVEAQPAGLLEISVGSNGSTVEGVVVGDKGQPVRNATVVLVPDVTLRQRSSMYKFTTSDASGSFRIASIGPGDYKVFAWDSVETGAWEDPDFLRSFEGRGQSITLREGAGQTLQLSPLTSPGTVYNACQPASLGPR
jgi:hypothetical protein